MIHPTKDWSVAEINEVIRSVAVVIGGLWAAWTFRKLQRARTAEVNIEESKLQNEKIRVELARRQPLLTVEMTVLEKNASIDPLGVMVSLKNEGEKPLEVTFGPDALTCARMTIHDEKCAASWIYRAQHTYFKKGDSRQYAFEPRLFRSGQTRRLGFAVPAREPGLYFLQFHATYHSAKMDGEIDAGGVSTPVDAYEQKLHVLDAHAVDA